MIKHGNVAVIDIGSNSVRLVIYDEIKRSPFPIFNEKVLCGLATGMAKTGSLDKEGVQAAYACIGRFMALCEVMKVPNIYVFATSAVRDAKDGQKFVEKLKADFNCPVQIFSGEEEAIYAGYGIISSMAEASGVVADLGGGSLELIGIKAGKLICEGASFPIGPLRISGDRRKFAAYQRMVDDSLQDFPLDAYAKSQSIYLIGGAFRAIAKVHMLRTSYPLKVIHHYTVEVEALLRTLQIIAKMSPRLLEGLPDIPSSRSHFLPFAAAVLMQMIKQASPKNIVFSVTGVREGVLFEKLKTNEQKKDPLIAGCIDMAKTIRLEPEYGFELAQWLEPLFGNVPPERKRLILAACILSDIACYEHAEYRAEIAYERILDSSLLGINHQERAFIAQALYYRYRFGKETVVNALVTTLISKSDAQQAKLLGTAMRLARSLSGSHVGVLPNITLVYTKEKIEMQFIPSHKLLYGEKIAKRLSQLASVLKVKPSVKK